MKVWTKTKISSGPQPQLRLSFLGPEDIGGLGSVVGFLRSRLGYQCQAGTEDPDLLPVPNPVFSDRTSVTSIFTP